MALSKTLNTNGIFDIVMIELLLNGNVIELDDCSLQNCEKIIAICSSFDAFYYGADGKCVSIPNSSVFGLNPTTACVHFRGTHLSSICFAWYFDSENPKYSEIRKRRKQTRKLISNILHLSPKFSFPLFDSAKWHLGHVSIVHEIFDRFGYEEDISIRFKE